MANPQKEQNDIAQLSIRYLKEGRHSLIEQKRASLMEASQGGFNRDIA